MRATSRTSGHAASPDPRLPPRRSTRLLFPRRADDGARPARSTSACGRWSAARCARATRCSCRRQYLEEADELADEIAVVDHGRIIAAARRVAQAQVGGERIEVVVHDRERLSEAAAALCGRRSAARSRSTRSGSRHGARRCAAAGRGEFARSATRASRWSDVGLRRPTLDDVFLSLTGRAAEEINEETEQ